MIVTRKRDKLRIVSIILSVIIIISCAIPMMSCDSSFDKTEEIGVEDVDNMIRGTWRNNSSGLISTYMYVTFENGKFETGVKFVNGDSTALSVVGEYGVADGKIILTKGNGEIHTIYNYTIEDGTINKLIESNGHEWTKIN